MKKNLRRDPLLFMEGKVKRVRKGKGGEKRRPGSGLEDKEGSMEGVGGTHTMPVVTDRVATRLTPRGKGIREMVRSTREQVMFWTTQYARAECW